MSGDMNTAMGNCLLMCAMVWTRFKELGIDGELVNNGDDCVVIVEEHDLDIFMQEIDRWFLSYGFTMKVEEPVRVFEQIQFCQMQPVFDGVGWRMVRDPRISMDKDGINLRPGNQSFGDWLSTVGECGIAITSGIPILQEYYLLLSKQGKVRNMESCGMRYLRGDLPSRWSKVSDAARVSFWRAFNIDPQRQIAIEGQLRCASIDVSGLMSQEVVSSINYQL